ncbi:hypothetical protein ES708_19316 [subsurface metagenome]
MIRRTCYFSVISLFLLTSFVSAQSPDSFTQLTTDSGLKLTNCDWSPDGNWIAFMSQGYIKIISPDGGDPRSLNDDVTVYSANPHFTADSKAVTYTRWEEEAVIERLTIDDPPKFSIIHNNVLDGFTSNDGKYLTFTVRDYRDSNNRYDMKIINLESKTVTNILDMRDYGRGRFSYDDSYIITGHFNDSGELRLFKVPIADGGPAGEPVQLTSHEGNHMYPSRMTKDGWIVYNDREIDYEKNLKHLVMYAYNVNTNESKRVFPDISEPHGYGCLSPDSKKVAFFMGTNLTSDMDLYVADFPF